MQPHQIPRGASAHRPTRPQQYLHTPQPAGHGRLPVQHSSPTVASRAASPFKGGSGMAHSPRNIPLPSQPSVHGQLRVEPRFRNLSMASGTSLESSATDTMRSPRQHQTAVPLVPFEASPATDPVQSSRKHQRTVHIDDSAVGHEPKGKVNTVLLVLQDLRIHPLTCALSPSCAPTNVLSSRAGERICPARRTGAQNGAHPMGMLCVSQPVIGAHTGGGGGLIAGNFAF